MSKRHLLIVIIVLLFAGCAAQSASTPTPTPQTDSEIQSVHFEEYNHDLESWKNPWNISYNAESDTVVIYGILAGGFHCQERFLQEVTYNSSVNTLHVAAVVVDKQPHPKDCSAAVRKFEYRLKVVLNEVALQTVHVTHINQGTKNAEVSVTVN